MAHLKKIRIVRYLDATGNRVAKSTAGARRVAEKSAKWYGIFRDKQGVRHKVPLSPNKAVAQQMLNRLSDKVERGKVGWGNHDEHGRRPLAEHLDDFAAELRTSTRGKRKRPPSARQVRQKVGRIRRVLDACGLFLPADVTLAKVQEFLATLTVGGADAEQGQDKEAYTLAEVAGTLGIKAASVAPLLARHGLQGEGNGKARRFPRAVVEALLTRRARGLGTGTAGYYAREVKAFTKWLAKRERIPDDPLADLSGASAESDHRHDRRTPSEDELRTIIGTADASAATFRGLAGRDRALLYAVAMSTGLRVEELGSLTPESFDLDGEPAAVTLRGEAAKNGRAAVQPLPTELVSVLRPYLSGRDPARPVWPGTWTRKAAAMLRRDLDAAGIPYTVEGPDGPLYLDFHALRHGYVALLDKAGASLKEAMQLARHTDPKLTMARYGRARLHDLAAAVGRMPRLLPNGDTAPRRHAQPGPTAYLPEVWLPPWLPSRAITDADS